MTMITNAANGRATGPRLQELGRQALGQVVLVLQGGGALGAYQIGVYEALHEAGIEPDWVVGTSIGAINASIIAGNPPEQRLTRLTGPDAVEESGASGAAGDVPCWNSMTSACGRTGLVGRNH